ncbi:MAG TPA: hypothetical protein VMS40_25685 [Vicinamibacterales bacterium]|nr:hypothetical protein [Vicinamibacterales bacterium]
MRDYNPFEPAPLTFIVLPVFLACLLVWGTAAAWRRSGAPSDTARRAAVMSVVAACAWMAITWIVAASGVFREWERTPPPFAFLVIAVFALGFAIAFSRFGARIATALPLWVLVLVQGFRLPLELAMHGMYTRGIMPVQMTYTGLNFDIVTGALAIVVGVLAAAGKAGRGIVAAWNILGLALLMNVVTVAILGTPRFRYFGDDHLNVWVTYPPFVWLPAVMVLAALAGHLVIFRALLASRPAGPR